MSIQTQQELAREVGDAVLESLRVFANERGEKYCRENNARGGEFFMGLVSGLASACALIYMRAHDIPGEHKPRVCQSFRGALKYVWADLATEGIIKEPWNTKDT